MKNKFCLVLGALLVILSVSADAEQAKKIPMVGYVIASSPSAVAHQVEGFRQGLRDRGYSDGKNILIELRYAEGKLDRVPGLVAELVQLKVDVLVSGNLPTIRAAKQATKTIPVVMVIAEDPVATGLVDSLAHPGGNITGVTRLTRDLSGKRLELLKEAFPGISRVGVLEDATRNITFKEYEVAARALKVQLQSLEVRGPNPDLEGAFQAAAKARASALIVGRTATLNRYRMQIVDLAIKNRLPSMCEGDDYVEAGCLMSYSANDADQFRRAAYFVDKILKGTKPAEIPVEQPTKFDFVINLKTAKRVGVTVPQSVLYRADKVIK